MNSSQGSPPETEDDLNNDLTTILNNKSYGIRLSSADVAHFETVAAMSNVCNQVEALMVKTEENFPDICNRAGFQCGNIQSAINRLNGGDFFASMDDVCDTITMSCANVEIGTFDRPHIEHAVLQGEKDWYVKTAILARSDSYEVADESSRTGPDAMCTIFGEYKMVSTQSAHLIPYSVPYSTLWYHVVPWVIGRKENAIASTGNNISLEINQWYYLQKSIHGSKLIESSNGDKKDGGGVEKSAATNSDKAQDASRKRKEMDETQTFTKTNVDVLKVPVAKNSVKIEEKVNVLATGTGQLSACSKWGSRASSKRNKASRVGIKHFPTNRIQVNSQVFLDTHPGILVIPILPIADVIKWNYQGYHAIVLAEEWTTRKKVTFSPADMYKDFGTSEGRLSFATHSECETACSLLAKAILCVYKSCKETCTNSFDFLRNEIKDKQRFVEISRCLEMGNEFLVPKCKQWADNAHINVRKVSFSASDEFNNNPAPDPQLLLSKSASIWFKRMSLNLLPGCCDDDSTADSVADNSSIASGSVVSLRDEAAARGWNIDIAKVEQKQDVTFNSCESVDESLSDIEE